MKIDNKVLEFINKNFSSEYDKNQLINMKKLLLFIEENNYNNIDIDACKYLLDSSKKLKNMIKYILYLKDDTLLQNDFIYSLSLVYLDNENINVVYYNNFYNSKNGIKDYLNEIGKIPLLTREEEIYLSKEIKKGNIDAKNKFVESNLRLVISIAKRYKGRDVDFEDLIEEGNLGLLTAIEKYDYTRGYKFSTYASYWIREAIGEAIRKQTKPMSYAIHVLDDLTKMNAVIARLKLILGRMPDDQEIADEMMCDINKIIYLKSINYQTISLNTPIDKDSDSEYQDFIEDDKIDDDYFIRRIYLEEFNKLVFKIITKPRYVEFIKKRYGFDGEAESLSQIAKDFGISREASRQIENKILRIFARNPEIREFEENSILENRDLLLPSSNSYKRLLKEKITNKEEK